MNNIPQYFGKGNKNGFGATHIFLTPAYNQINKPKKEDKEAYPGFAGYDLSPFDADTPQSFQVTHIINYRVKTYRRYDKDEANVEELYLDGIENEFAIYEDLFTFYVFSPWKTEKNALNQVSDYLEKRFELNKQEEKPYLSYKVNFESCVALV